ncbi:MAG: ATP-binding protein [Candidatus Omnitrophota bacterium]|nr:ATP-binding protein [Candidatus Omnitrophota bacterium]
MNLYSIPPLIISLLLVFSGIFVYLKNKKHLLNRLFLLLCFPASVWLFFFSMAYNFHEKNILITCLKVGYTGIIFIPITVFHYTVELVSLQKLRKLVYLSYLIGIFLAASIWISSYLINGVQRYFWGYYPLAGKFHYIFLLFFNILLAISYTIVFYSLWIKKNISSSLRKTQVKYLLLAFFVYNLASFDFLPNYGREIYPFGYLPAFLFILIVGYTIIKYRLMDIRILLTRAGIFIFIYTFVLGFPLWFGIKTGLWIWAVLLMGVLSTVGPFIYSYLRQQIENAMFKEQQRYQQSIRELAKRMTQIRELDKLFVEVIAEVYSVVQPQFIALYTFSTSEKSYVLSRHHLPKDYSFDKQISLNSQLITMLSKNKRPILAESAGFSNLPLETLVVPYFTEGSLFAFLVLGQKSTKMIYSDSDFIVFDILSSQVSLAIENCLFWQEEKTRLAKEEQIRRQRAMDHFSASLAHEIDNPVFAVSGIAEVVKMEITEDLKNNIPQDKLNYLSDRLNRITGDLSRISKMIKAVREFSSQTKGEQVEMKFEEVLEGFSSIVEPQLKYEGIFFEKEIELDIRLKANKIHLEEVLVNLATNAIHAVKHNNQKEKKITLKVYRNSAKTFMIEFKDNGYGIKPEFIEDIFLDFVTTKASTEGTGIGLGRVRKIVENHGGKIWAQSDGEGKGATFLIELPLL